ncbi:MAG: polysaccharide biosynthesis C-terminal domain-containing protein, partial [Bryobacteraceae bacterium]
ALPMCIAPVWLRHTSTEFRVAAIVLTAGLFPSAYALANDALFLGLGRASYSLAIAFCENIFRLLGSLLVVFFWHGGLLYLAVIYALSRCLAACGQQLVIRQLLHLTVPKADRLIVREMLRRAPSFSTVFVAPLVLLRLDIVILGIIGGPAQVGLYSAAMRLLSVCLILPDGIMTATFALLSKLSALDNPACFRRLVDRTLKWMGAGLLPVSAAMALLAPFGMPLLYGPKFAVAIPVLKTLSWSLVPFAVNRAIGDALVARGLQKIVARIVVINCGVSVFLYVLLIHISPLEGAAWAFNLSILCFCLLSVREALGRVEIVAPRAVWRALLPAIAGSAVFAWTNSVLWQAIWFMAALILLAIPVVQALRPGLTSRSSEMTRIPAGVQ